MVPGEEKERAPHSTKEWTEPVGVEINERSRACRACSGSDDTNSVSLDCVLGVGGSNEYVVSRDTSEKSSFVAGSEDKSPSCFACGIPSGMYGIWNSGSEFEGFLTRPALHLHWPFHSV